MKQLHKIVLAMLIIVLSLTTFMAYAEPSSDEEIVSYEEKKPKSICPKTQMVEDCLKCHTAPSFKLKETDAITEQLDLPFGLELVDSGTQPLYFYFLMDSISPTPLLNAFQYMDRHPELPKKLVIEVHSPGGHAFDGWRVVNIIRNYWPKYDIETRLNGMAFSAGFMIFEAGEKRCVGPTAELMWHEIAYYEFLAKNTPTGSEDKAKMMRHLQDTANGWLVSRTNGKMTKEELDKKAAGQSGWWFNGDEALKYGFADDCSGLLTAN